MLSRDEIDALFPSNLPDPGNWEARYPPRELPPDAMVTRFCPSPTGFAHLGGMLFGWLMIRYWRGQPPFRKPPRNNIRRV